jgi:hypothetical protein
MLSFGKERRPKKKKDLHPSIPSLSHKVLTSKKKGTRALQFEKLAVGWLLKRKKLCPNLLSFVFRVHKLQVI